MPLSVLKHLWKRLRFQRQSRVLKSTKVQPAWIRKYRTGVYVLALIALGFIIVEAGLRWQMPPVLQRISIITDLLVFISFTFDSTLSWYYMTPRRNYLKENFLDIIVFLPFVLQMISMQTGAGLVIIRYFIVFIKMFSRTRKFTKLLQGIRLNTAQIIVLSFMTTILIGAILLTFPAATSDGHGASFTDAVFTATSATCVTGLIVQDTPSYFTHFGQVVILVLIQLGGLGIMTYSAFVALLFGRFTFGQRQMMQEMLDEDKNVYSMIFYIFRMTFIVELIGMILLFSRWLFDFDSPLTALYYSIFHSISAFCNAGFSLFSDSLVQYSGDAVVNLTVMLLIIMGGLGFIVIHDLARRIRRKERLSPHSKLVLTASSALIIVGFLAIFFFEFDGQLRGQPLSGQLWTALFQSVTARTAGFNTLQIGDLSRVTMAIIVGLMFIGASPGSTGGGIKTSTFAVLLLSIRSTLLGRERVEVLKRTIPDSVVRKALALTVSAGLTVVLVLILLMSWETHNTSALLFETVSAFGTVGLSTGVTPELTLQGRWLIAMLMFLGRIGPLTLGIALARGVRHARIGYPDARILIG